MAINLEGNEYHASGSGSATGYLVECRSTYPSGTAVGDKFFIGNTWREIPILEQTPGIPIGYDFGGMWQHAHLLSLAAAEAMEAVFVAQLTAVHKELCVETRLVAVEFKWSYECREIGVTQPQSADRRERDIGPLVSRKGEVDK